MKTKIGYSLALLISIISYCNSIAQSDTSFTYKGKPIPPEALLTFFPDLYIDSKTYDSIVDLDTCIYPVQVDAYLINKKLAYVYTSAKGINTTAYPNCDMGYSYYAKHNNTYIIEGSLCGNWKNASMAYTFFISLKENKLHRLGGFIPSGKIPYRIVGNEIIDGAKHYKIP